MEKTVHLTASSPRGIDAAALGGTLFVPASHKHLETIARGGKFPRLRSVVFDTEDGLDAGALPEALQRLRWLLPTLEETGPLRFIRPRNVDVLREILQFEGIEKIDGFILPKFGLDNADSYLESIGEHLFMPSIEGRELFDVAALAKLRDLLMPYKEQIILVRFGAEDMFRQLGLRRSCEHSIYDMCAPSAVIGNLLGVFKPYGFDVSAPVFGCYKDMAGFEKEVLRDLREGLVSKTIIHPDQIEPVERLYRVSEGEYEIARKILETGKAVSGLNGEMAERSTQQPWARRIVRRAEVYGIG